jgi:hypothetical protein
MEVLQMLTISSWERFASSEIGVDAADALERGKVL